MARRRSSLLALAALALLGARAEGEGREPSAIRWEEGARALADTWTQDDGCPARTAATETVPLTGPREPAWQFNVSGEIEGDPLAWRGKTFVVERSGAKRVLHVLATATGAERYRQVFPTPLPLAPTVQEGRIVLRTSPRTVQGFTVGEKALVARWTLSAKAGIGPPTVLRNEVYVVVDGVLQRRAYGTQEVVWPRMGATAVVAAGTAVAGGGAKGGATEYPRPSLRGGSVYLATGKRLVEVDRQDGSLRREAAIAGDAPSSRVLVGLGDVLVAIRSEAGEVVTRLGRPESGPFEERGVLTAPQGLASVGRDWVGVLSRGSAGAALLLLEGAGRDAEAGTELATPAMHAEYLAAKAPPSAAGDVVLVGGRAFDAGTFDVLCADALPSSSRTIPLRDRLLFTESRTRVSSWRSAKKPLAAPPLRLLPADAGPLPPAHAVVEGGRVVAGGFVVDAKAGTLRGTGKPGDAGAWPLASVAALVTDEAPRRLLLGARPEEAAAGAAAIARAAAGAEIAALVPRAVESGDADLAERALAAAGERSAPDAALAAGEKALAGLAPGAPRSEERAAEVEALLRALLSREADALVEIASSLPPEAPRAYGTSLVRVAVEGSPFHAGATEWVRSRLPAGVEPRGFQDLADWLDFLDLYAAGSVRVLAPGAPPPEGVPEAATSAVARARTSWREDLVGFLNGPLLVVSPPERPGAIARCLVLGRVVSDALDAAFASMGPRRPEDEVLVLHLFSNKSDYLAQSRDGAGEGGFGGLEHSAGHYSPAANVTRIFFPSEGGRQDSVLRTYAHELTHHWIARRRPPRPGDDGGDRAGGPGYFVVEGFADFVKDFAYDAAAGRAEPANPRAEYADVVAGLPEAATIPWGKILSMPQREAYAGMAEGETKIPLRWRMGLEGRFTRGNVYYAQAAALTAYLFLAEGGRNRAALLSFLYDHYAGAADPEALPKALGVGADELGARVVRWCRSVGASPPPAPTAPRPK